MSKYAKYKKVNEKWVDEIPAHWEMKRLKGIFALRSEKNNPVKTDRILSLTAKQGVIPYEEKDSMGGNKPKADLTKYNVCHVNDLLVNCMNVVSGSAGVSKYEGAISPVYYALYPHKNDNVWYYHHIFRLDPFQKSLVGLGKGILMHESEEGKLTSVRMRISMDYLGNVMLPMPSREEQDKISKYLRCNISKIDSIVRKRITYKSELEDIRKAIVNKVLSKGILNHTEFKNSNIEWLQRIPKDWDITRVKVHIVIEHGTDPKSKGEIPVYGSGSSKFKTCGEYKIGPAVLLGRKGTLNNPQYIEGKYWNVDTAFNAYSRDDMIDIKYFYYVATQFNYDYYSTQTAIPSMTQFDYKNMLIPVPSIDEQVLISNQLDRKLDKLNKLILLQDRYIEELNNLRNRIISDSVTGKINVQNIDVPEYVSQNEINLDSVSYDEENENIEEVDE